MLIERQHRSQRINERPMSEIVTNEFLADSHLHRLADVRLGLLRLHKALLEMERIDYEKVFGRVTAGELLQLVINHARFGWLRIISALVVEIDGVHVLFGTAVGFERGVVAVDQEGGAGEGARGHGVSLRGIALD